jgi:hypothetical protein
MQLKEYQQRALAEIRNYLEHLSAWHKKAEANPDLEIDFPAKGWEKARIPRRYVPRKNGLGNLLPTFCLKVPTGGGKTLLAVKTIDLANMIYRKRKTGLVLWIVPTTQIYRQTIQHLKDRDHPYRQHLDLATGGHTLILEKTDRFSPLDVEESLVVLMLMLTDYESVYVVETKGLHLKDNAKTDYIRRVFDICTQQAKSRSWSELGLEMKGKVLRFEVLAEDEWEAKLNKILAESTG